MSLFDAADPRFINFTFIREDSESYVHGIHGHGRMTSSLLLSRGWKCAYSIEGADASRPDTRSRRFNSEERSRGSTTKISLRVDLRSSKSSTNAVLCGCFITKTRNIGRYFVQFSPNSRVISPKSNSRPVDAIFSENDLRFN